MPISESKKGGLPLDICVHRKRFRRQISDNRVYHAEGAAVLAKVESNKPLLYPYLGRRNGSSESVLLSELIRKTVSAGLVNGKQKVMMPGGRFGTEIT